MDAWFTLEGVLRLVLTGLAAWLAYRIVEHVDWGVLWARWQAWRTRTGHFFWLRDEGLLPVLKRVTAFLLSSLFAGCAILLLILLAFEPLPPNARAWIVTLVDGALKAFFINHTLHTALDLPRKRPSPADLPVR
jgi:hypothetical protein